MFKPGAHIAAGKINKYRRECFCTLLWFININIQGNTFINKLKCF